MQRETAEVQFCTDGYSLSGQLEIQSANTATMAATEEAEQSAVDSAVAVVAFAAVVRANAAVVRANAAVDCTFAAAAASPVPSADQGVAQAKQKRWERRCFWIHIHN